MQHVDSQTLLGIPLIFKNGQYTRIFDGLGQRIGPLMSPFARVKPKVRTVTDNSIGGCWDCRFLPFALFLDLLHFIRILATFCGGGPLAPTGGTCRDAGITNIGGYSGLAV